MKRACSFLGVCVFLYCLGGNKGLAQVLGTTQFSSLTSLRDLKSEGITGFTRSATGEYRPIDEKEYLIDSGDEFVIKIDPPGPDLKTYFSRVTSDGNLIIPECQGWYLRGIKLFDARMRVINDLKKLFPEAQVEIYLEKVRPINVSLIGALQNFKEVNLNSASRLFDLMNAVLAVYQSDSALNLKLAQVSLRNIKIIRKNETINCDLLRFHLMGNINNNPYLQNNDIIYVSFHDTNSNNITVQGSVNNPLRFEFKPGDKLKTAIDFAAGISQAGDSNRIEVYRFKGKSSDFEILTCHIPADTNLPLQPDDRIFVRRKADYHLNKYVVIKGEARYPGLYPIEEGKTRLSDIMKLAGYTSNASLTHSRLYRILNVPGAEELYKIIRAMPFSMSLDWIESNFWRSTAKENLNIILVDFEKLIKNNDATQDVVLNNNDIIVIASKKHYVYVTGSVRKPGTVLYNPDWNYLDYIQGAGGFKERARKSRIKIIKHNTETWLDADKELVVEPGDRIFVPQRDQKEPFDIFYQSLTIITQIITIILVLRNIR
jgi:protein involved in polysaccharide export with SLBB domain